MGGKHVIGVVAELKREGKFNEIGTFSLVILSVITSYNCRYFAKYFSRRTIHSSDVHDFWIRRRRERLVSAKPS